MSREYWRERIVTARMRRGNETDSEWIKVLDDEIGQLDRENLRLWVELRQLASVVRSGLVGMSYLLNHMHTNFVAGTPEKADASAAEILGNLEKLISVTDHLLKAKPPGIQETDPNEEGESNE